LGLCYFFFNKNLSYKGVFDETTLKNLKLKNRVFFGAIIHDLQKIEKIAQNDVSLIITDGAIVGDLPPSLDNEKLFRVDKDEYIEELKKFPETVHKYNSYILLDLVHLGLHSPFEPIFSPSGDKSLQKGIQSKEMTKEDILRVQDFFVQGAIRAKKAGFDGIEIHAGHLTLCSSFLSKKFNRRNDDYGGSDEKRAKFLVEIEKKLEKQLEMI
jgi:2,4-dienoyl-CoA reductase-like NADH-dependent reductase (Old Yellow Enzyme family)